MVHGIIGIMLIVVSISTILLISAQQVLIRYFNQVRKDTTLVNIKNKGASSDIEIINQKLEIAEQAQQTFTKWSALLTDFTDMIPEGIVLDFMYINEQSGTFRISGFAQTRDSLIAAKERIESNPIVTSLDAPLSNFLKREDIEFRFTGTLNASAYQNASHPAALPETL